MSTIGDFNRFWGFFWDTLYRVSEKKLMPFQIQISASREFHYGLLPWVCIVVLFLTLSCF